MKTGFLQGFANLTLNWIYHSHGITEICYKQADRKALFTYPTSGETLYVITVTAYNITNISAMLKGEVVALIGTGKHDWRGFQYWPEGSVEYLIVFEFGDFEEGEFSLYAGLNL